MFMKKLNINLPLHKRDSSALIRQQSNVEFFKIEVRFDVFSPTVKQANIFARNSQQLYVSLLELLKECVGRQVLRW